MTYLQSSLLFPIRYVKDKRPTISPNFNFLGQLMEYEQKLRSQRKEQQVHSTDSSTSHEVKKQCIEELRSPMTPTTPSFPAGPRRSFTLHLKPQFEASPVQSPTTALAKLNFNSAPSPIIESPAGNGDFPHFPTTSLDKLSFTPCLAKEDSPLKALSGKPSGGTKRPLSTSSMDNSPPDSMCHTGSGLQSPIDRSKSDCAKVTRRSAESKAKRSLVRPNSIAFSTYPMFDFASDSKGSTLPGSLSPSQPPSTVSPNGTGVGKLRSPSVDSGLPGPHLKEMRTPPRRVTSPMEEDVSHRKVKDPGLLRHKTLSDNNGMNNLEQARKSRSLEDILNSPEEENTLCDCPHGAWHTPARPHSHHRQIVQAADVFPQPTVLDRAQCRCRGLSDPHQSSSSISSSGSHTSLHGSMELIQVS